MPSKLPYRVFSVSSQDSKCLASDLAYNSNSETPADPHWESQRYCIFPQEIIFQFNSTVKIEQLKVISHPTKIPSRIDVLSQAQSNSKDKSANYTHLGHFSFGDNSDNEFKAVEEKTIYVETVCKQFKLSIKSHHKNALNIFGQVGLINVSFIGEPCSNSDVKDSENLDLQLNDKMPKATYSQEKQANEILQEKISTLQLAKQKAVESDNFDEAKSLKEEIEGFSKFADKINDLEQRKKEAIRKEEYDAAKLLKAELEQLKQTIMQTNSSASITIKPYPIISPPTEISNTEESKKEEAQQPQTNSPISVTNNTPPKPLKEFKKVINVDTIVLPGMNAKPIDYKSVTEDDIAQPIVEVEDIPENKRAYAQPLIELISEDTTKRLLSKKWQNREAAINMIIGKMRDILSKGESALTLMMGIVKESISDKLSYVSVPAMSMYLKIHEEIVSMKISAKLDMQSTELLNAYILDYLSDPNNKVTKKALATYVSLSVCGSSDFNSWLAFMFKKSSSVNSKIANSTKNVEGRLEVIKKMLEKSEFLTKKLAALVSPNTMKQLLQFIVACINKPQKGVRDVSSDLLVDIYNAYGYKKIEGEVIQLNKNAMMTLAKSIPELTPLIEKAKPKVKEPEEGEAEEQQ